MAYIRGQPVGTDNLSVSQPILATNTNAADDSFGTDHYKFSDLTANNGFHNSVTTPTIVGAVHPTTAVGIPKFYAMQDSGNLGVLQYSRGPNIAAPSPVTFLQSQVAGIVLANNATTNILDFTGLNRAICMVYAINQDAANFLTSIASVNWLNSSSTFSITKVVGNVAGLLVIQNTGNILQVKNTTGAGVNTVFWTMQLFRTT